MHVGGEMSSGAKGDTRLRGVFLQGVRYLITICEVCFKGEVCFVDKTYHIMTSCSG
jgi:hypothetical protein